mgnify:CR=1 FL=1
MNRREILFVIGFLVILAGVVYLIKRPKTKTEPISTPDFSQVQQKLEKNFNLQIPENIDKAQLKDVTGGNASGIATRKFEAGKFFHTVLADLPDPAKGYFYEGWLVRAKQGDSDFDFFSTGRMKMTKGGWILEYQSTKNYPDHKGVVITLEKVADKKPEKHILEGSF